jgi:hypothetical protein
MRVHGVNSSKILAYASKQRTFTYHDCVLFLARARMASCALRRHRLNAVDTVSEISREKRRCTLARGLMGAVPTGSGRQGALPNGSG